MKIQHTMAAAIIAMAAFSAGSANAAIVLQDDFDSSTAVLNWGGDSVFVSVPGPGNVQGVPSVDLVSNTNGYGSLTFSGNSVDLDGTTGNGNQPAGEIASVQSLALGSYNVSFVLAGNLRGATPQETVISIGNQSITLTPPASQGYTAYSLNFTNASGKVDFKDLFTSDQQGNLLDNVVVSSVPEPAAWTMMIIGFGAVGFAMRGKRRKSAALASI